MGFLTLTSYPVLAYDSDNGSDQITLNLTSLGAPSVSTVNIYMLPPTLGSGSALWKAARIATGTFTITGLSKGRHIFFAVAEDASGNVAHGSAPISVFLGTQQGFVAMLEHVENALIDMIWTSAKVFKKVSITDRNPRDMIDMAQFPAAYVVPRRKQPSPHGGSNYRGFKQVTFDVMMYIQQYGDEYGRGAAIGSHRDTNNDGSNGVGITELLEHVEGQLEYQCTPNGTRYVYVDSGSQELELAGGEAWEGIITYQAEVWGGE